MTQAFNLLKGEGGKQEHRVRNIWGEMIESRVIIGLLVIGLIAGFFWLKNRKESS